MTPRSAARRSANRSGTGTSTVAGRNGPPAPDRSASGETRSRPVIGEPAKELREPHPGADDPMIPQGCDIKPRSDLRVWASHLRPATGPTPVGRPTAPSLYAIAALRFLGYTFDELLTSHEPQGEEGDRRSGTGTSTVAVQRTLPDSPGPSTPGSEAGSTTTGPSTAPSCMPSQRARRTSCPMGDAEVQTIARPTHQSVEMARRCPSARATTLRSLAPPRFNPTPNCGSRMTGDCHVRF